MQTSWCNRCHLLKEIYKSHWLCDGIKLTNYIDIKSNLCHDKYSILHEINNLIDKIKFPSDVNHRSGPFIWIHSYSAFDENTEAEWQSLFPFKSYFNNRRQLEYDIDGEKIDYDNSCDDKNNYDNKYNKNQDEKTRTSKWSLERIIYKDIKEAVKDIINYKVCNRYNHAQDINYHKLGLSSFIRLKKFRGKIEYNFDKTSFRIPFLNFSKREEVNNYCGIVLYADLPRGSNNADIYALIDISSLVNRFSFKLCKFDFNLEKGLNILNMYLKSMTYLDFDSISVIINYTPISLNLF